MTIQQRVDRLISRMEQEPQYPSQGCVLFVDLAAREARRAYLPKSVLRLTLGGRGANMYLLYNLLEDGREPLDPQVPLIFGSGALTGAASCATRSNVTGLSPDSHAILDANGGDAFPSFMKRHGYDHVVLYGEAAEWTLLKLSGPNVEFLSAANYVGLDNMDTAAALERDFQAKERFTMAVARITRAGENGVLSAGIMGGIKAIWARGGAGAKMGALKLKGVMIHGKAPEPLSVADMKPVNKALMEKILSTSVIKNALKTVGTPFLYKPSRALGALGAKNNQETGWVENLDADNFDPYRPGMDGCLKCPVRCRAGNDMTPTGKSGWGAGALKGVKGNASYDVALTEIDHGATKRWQGKNGDGVYDKYDHGDGPEYVTVGKFGPNIGITEPEHVLRANNILNDLGLDSASAGGAIAWAMELYQRGIITKDDTGGLDLSWGNWPAVEELLFLTAERKGFGAVIADSGRAVETGKYPAEALKYRMTVKGLFQSDPHDARILKAFALGLAVATRGMDHLRSRPTLEINARVNDDPAFKTELYGGVVSPKPNAYEGKEYAVRKCENTYAVGDSLGMCRFETRLFNSPSLPGYEDFCELLEAVTGEAFTPPELDEIGRTIAGIERLINYRIGLRADDDTLPDRWFDEPNTAGPFKGEKIDRVQFAQMKARFYQVTGLNAEGVPNLAWHTELAEKLTGSAITVRLPKALPGAPEKAVVVDEPVSNLADLRATLARRFPEAMAALEDRAINLALNGTMVMSGEATTAVRSGDDVELVTAIAGG